MHQCINASMYQCINASMYQCINASMHQCINVSMHQCINVSMYQCINVSMYRCINASMYQCINVSKWGATHCTVENMTSTAVCCVLHFYPFLCLGLLCVVFPLPFSIICSCSLPSPCDVAAPVPAEPLQTRPQLTQLLCASSQGSGTCVSGTSRPLLHRSVHWGCGSYTRGRRGAPSMVCSFRHHM